MCTKNILDIYLYIIVIDTYLGRKHLPHLIHPPNISNFLGYKQTFVTHLYTIYNIYDNINIY